MSHLFSQLTFARYYMPMFLPGVEKAIYLDDDVIVQGLVTFIIAFVTKKKCGSQSSVYCNFLTMNWG